MKPEFRITDIETMKVFADANRLAILQLLGEPRSVKEIAEAMDVPRTRLYHHINMMEEHGLIEIVDTRETGRIPEHLYQAVAHRYQPSDELLASPDLAAQAEATLGAIFDVTRADLHRSITSGTVGLDQKDRMGLSRQVARLTPDQAAEFIERLEALVDEIAGSKSDNPDAVAYAFTWAFYPSAFATNGEPS